MHNLFVFQPLLFYPIRGNALERIAQQNKAPLGLMLYNQQLLYKDRVGVRGVKEIGPEQNLSIPEVTGQNRIDWPSFPQLLPAADSRRAHRG